MNKTNKHRIYVHKHWEIVKVELRIFLEKVSNEVGETKEAAAILRKEAAGLPITIEEKKKVREQVFDVLKTVGIGIPFVLVPGASIILPFLIKFAETHGIRILPSSFEKQIPTIKEL